MGGGEGDFKKNRDIPPNFSLPTPEPTSMKRTWPAGEGGPNPRKKRGGWDEGAAAPFTPITGFGPPASQFQTPGSARPWEREPKKHRAQTGTRTTAAEPRLLGYLAESATAVALQVCRGSAGLLTPRSLPGTLYVGNMPSGMATEPMLTALFTKAVSCCEGFDPALGPPVLSVQMCGGGTCTPLPEPLAPAMPDEVRSDCAFALDQTLWSSSATCSSLRPCCSLTHARPHRTLRAETGRKLGLGPTLSLTLTLTLHPSPSPNPSPDPDH